MLVLELPGVELFDEATSFVTNSPSCSIRLEHSLLSVSKWESRFRKSFLSTTDKTTDELYSYVEDMLLHDAPENFKARLSPVELDTIYRYVESPESATTFGQMPNGRTRNELITSELIYYWMVAFTIPFEAEAWHLNRLLALVRICNVKQQKPTKQSKHQAAAQYRELNAKRRAEYGSKG